jgi:hypothetical protein
MIDKVVAVEMCWRCGEVWPIGFCGYDVDSNGELQPVCSDKDDCNPLNEGHA